MSDVTETIRKEMTQEINAVEGSRSYLESKYGQVWNTSEVQADFQIHGFGAPIVSVTRKVDGAQGSIMFQHSPRFYFSFTKK